MIAQLLGYATVGVNVRGSGCSGGTFSFFETLQKLAGKEARVTQVLVKVSDASKEMVQVKVALEQFTRGQPVSWIQVDTDKALGRMTERPTRDAIPIAAQEQLIVELYSK